MKRLNPGLIRLPEIRRFWNSSLVLEALARAREAARPVRPVQRVANAGGMVPSRQHHPPPQYREDPGRGYLREHRGGRRRRRYFPQGQRVLRPGRRYEARQFHPGQRDNDPRGGHLCRRVHQQGVPVRDQGHPEAPRGGPGNHRGGPLGGRAGEQGLRDPGWRHGPGAPGEHLLCLR